MDDYINDELTSLERAELLRSVGFNINKERGQVNGIKNICYEDTQGDLCIDLDTGKVNDFGDPYYSGDVVFLLKEVLGCDFEGVKSYIGQQTGRDFSQGEANKFSGKNNARNLYGKTKKSDRKNEGNNSKSKKRSRPESFWTTKKWKRMMECQENLEDGIPDGHEYITDYDGITLEQLMETGCGFYKFKDYEFGLSGFDYNELEYFVFPYKTGAMLYRRSEDGKDVKHVKNSKSKNSFFNVRKDDEKSNIIFVMKSPREAMNFGMYTTDWKVIGINSGENIQELNGYQEEQIKQIASPGGLIYVCMDCDNPDAYEFALMFSQSINKALEDRVGVRLINIHKHSNGDHKDITDIVQQAMKEGQWLQETPTLPHNLYTIIDKSLTESKVIQ